MINNSHSENIHFSWQDMLWRILLTGLLLLILAGSGITVFNTAKTHPNAQVLPTLTYDTNIAK